MTTDIDACLDHLRLQPADPRLAAMDASVMAALAKRRDQAAARRTLLFAGLLALGVGWAGALVPTVDAQAAPVQIGMSDLAPSRLLGQ